MPKRKSGRKPRTSAKEKITKLETAYGTQKQLAEKLGISTSTLRRYKKKDAIPNPDISNRMDRMLGGFSKKIKTEEFQEKYEKRLGIEHKEYDRPGFVTMSTREWAGQRFGNENRHLIEGAVRMAPYVRFPRGQPEFVEFIDDPYNPHVGKPAGSISIEILITRNPDYSEDWAKSLKRAETYEAILAVISPSGQKREWTFDETRDYVETNAMGQPTYITEYTPKFRMIPSDVIGFLIRD